MQSGKIVLTKGFVDSYPEVLPKIRGYWYTHSDQYGHTFVYHSYNDAVQEKERIEGLIGEGYTRGLYVDTINSGK